MHRPLVDEHCLFSRGTNMLREPQEVAQTLLQALRLPDRVMVSEIDIRPTIL